MKANSMEDGLQSFGQQEIDVAGETLTLLPQKMIWWAARKTLLVADTHFGKANTFRRAGIPVPEVMTGSMLQLLSETISEFHADRLVVLGDFVHSPVRGRHSFEASLVAWRQRHLQLELVLVRGNHDRGHEKLFECMDVRCETEPFVDGPFALCHFPNLDVENGSFKLAGHVHPAVRLKTGPGSREQIPCYYFTKTHGILPAFGAFTGCQVVRSEENALIFGVDGEEVVELTGLIT